MAGRKPKPLEGRQNFFNLVKTQMSFDTEAFNAMLRSQGVRLEHFRAIPDPRAMGSRGDVRHTAPIGNIDGYIYKCAGVFTGLFLSNSNSPQTAVEGILDSSHAYVTPPQFYDDSEDQIIVAAFDRLVLKDVEARVIAEQLVEASEFGLDRLSFPALCVEHLIGSDGYEYKENVDFKIQDGDIRWISQKRPGINTNTGVGEVFGIRYRYQASFVVRQLMHEIRVANVTDLTTGARYTERMPYQLMVARENVLRDVRRTTANSVTPDPRFTDAPTDGNLYGDTSGPLKPDFGKP